MNRRDALKHTTLLGGSAAFLSLWQACKAQDRTAWTPRFLSNEEALLVSALVDTILPKTDTPGGLDVKVDMYIDLMYDQVFDEEGQKQVKADLAAFDEKCVAQFGKAFHALDAAQRTSVLEAEESNSPKFTGGVWGHPVGEQKPVGFYRSFKSMAIGGYFTSEEIGKNVMSYDPIPGPFKGCIDRGDVGNAWSY